MAKMNRALLGGSIVLLITFGLFNLLHFIYHFVMARMLDVVTYGILASLFSIFYITGILSESIQTVITKYASAEREKGRLKSLLMKSLRKSSRFSAVLFALYLVIAVPLSGLLKIDYFLIRFFFLKMNIV